MEYFQIRSNFSASLFEAFRVRNIDRYEKNFGVLYCIQIVLLKQRNGEVNVMGS